LMESDRQDAEKTLTDDDEEEELHIYDGDSPKSDK